MKLETKRKIRRWVCKRLGLPETVEVPYPRLKAVPTADVAPVRHGQKIDITSADDFLPWCKCSVCGYDGLFLEDEYCSRCGAKLDGGQGG